MSEAKKNGADAGLYDAIVIGAGVAGLYQIYRLREAGFNVLGIDKAADVGGTWYWNRYPGCRFDSESYSYAYTFSDELAQEWDWKEHFSAQPDTLEYLNFVADKFDLRKNFQFNIEIKSAIFDEDGDRWDLETIDGQKFRTQFLVMATGILSATQMPRIEGMDSFKGTSFHTSRWPHDPNGRYEGDKSVYKGKRVGVIGSGATAVQLIPHVAQDAEQLYVFQRTANWCAPLGNSKITPAEQPALKARYPEINKFVKQTATAFMHEADPRSVFDVSDEEREALFEKLYGEPGFAIWLSNFKDVTTDMKANAYLSEFIANKIRGRVNDQVTAEKLVPTTHGFGQRRVPMETNYFEAYNRDNVTLVDVRENPIEQITPDGVKTTAEEYDLDLIIYATGFDVATGSITRIDIRGLGGESIKDKWSKELATYMGIQVAGYPNMFMHYGPHTVFSNFTPTVEMTVDWVTNLIDHMQKSQIGRIVPSRDAEVEWTAHAQEVAEGTILSKANSWMMGDNIEGKPRALLLYAGQAPEVRQKFKDVADGGYHEFELS